MEVLKTEDLFKDYCTSKKVVVKAIQGISLSIQKGSFFALAGVSGSGKTTLLNLLGGLDSPSSGKVYLDGHDIFTLKKNRLFDFRLNNIGFIFQDYNLLPVLSAFENVELIMMYQGVKLRERRNRALEMLKKVGLVEYIHTKPNELSGGQQQRVAIARALVTNPKIILADEPTANLDSKTAKEIIELMQKMNKEEGVTFLFSTHDPLVMENAEKVIQLKDGKIIA